ncbi:unknown [Bacteroides sp. CAG:702]|nr:unknown [Bacteroides sp. CAG:702]
MFPFSCVLWAIFLVLSASVLRQIARYLPHYRSENASKTHPKSSHDKFKTVSKIVNIESRKHPM